MRNRLSRFTVLIICLLFICCQSIGAYADNEEVIENDAKSVLKIYTYKDIKDYTDRNDAFGNYSSEASGFVAFNNSTLITNYHVIDGETFLLGVDDDDNRYYIYTVLCADKNADIAILEFSEPSILKPLDLYPDDEIKRGAPVITIGSPIGIKNLPSTGIVSSVKKENGIPYILITAPISHGSSGGVLLNSEGLVIGVTTGGFEEGQNVNVAVSIAVAQAMYNAWDGTKYDIGKQKTTAKMDFTGVYDHKQSVTPEATDVPEIIADSSSEPWVCPNCGAENISKFCLECGAEKPYWTCACGKLNSSNKFCGECGTSYLDLIDKFNSAVEKASKHDYADAIEVLKELGLFNSGSFETVVGNHAEALNYIGKTYYEQGIYLQENGGNHEDIIQAFTNAGDYGDAKEQINSENDRYRKAFYDAGLEHLNNGEFDEAVIAFQNAGTYQDAKDQVLAVYYAKGIKLLEDKEFESCREAFTSAGKYKDAEDMILKSYYVEAEFALEQKRYDDAIFLFTNAGEYSDARDRINGVYYARAEDALGNGDIEGAKSFFKMAGDYSDSKERIIKIDSDEKEKLYDSAVEAFNSGEYDQAYTMFKKLFDYRDAKARSVESQFCSINAEFNQINSDPATMTTADQKLLDNLLPKLEKISDNSEAKQLYKQISYIIAQYIQEVSLDSAIKYYQQAEDFLDAAEQLYACQMRKMEYMIGQGQIAGAIDYYHQYVDPDNKNDYVLIKPGDKGTHIKTILSLIKPVGIKTKDPIDVEEYKEGYVTYVKELEDHFRLTADGMITINEYEELDGAIYLGVDSAYVVTVLGKLADLSYITSLPETHSKYENRYVNGIKKAEKELGLLSDGIITRSEYDVIMGQEVTKPDYPQNLKGKANKDTVTLTWSKVPGAVRYVIRRNSEIIGVTNKTTWVDKEVKTNKSYQYSVLAQKYTENGYSYTINLSVPSYYKSYAIADIKNNRSSLIGSQVKINSLDIAYYFVIASDGSAINASGISKAKEKIDMFSKIIIRGVKGKDKIDIVVYNLPDWGFNSGIKEFLATLERKDKMTVSGTVSSEQYSGDPDILSINAEKISWH